MSKKILKKIIPATFDKVEKETYTSAGVACSVVTF